MRGRLELTSSSLRPLTSASTNSYDYDTFLGLVSVADCAYIPADAYSVPHGLPHETKFLRRLESRMSKSVSKQLLLQKRTRASRVFVFVLLSLVALLWLLGLVSELTGTGTGFPGSDGPGSLIALSLLSILLIGLAFTYSEIQVHEDRVQIRYFPFFHRSIPFDEIADVGAVKLPLARFGIGWRFYGAGNMGLIARSGDGVYISLASRGGYYVSVDSQDDAKEIVDLFQAKLSM